MSECQALEPDMVAHVYSSHFLGVLRTDVTTGVESGVTTGVQSGVTTGVETGNRC